MTIHVDCRHELVTIFCHLSCTQMTIYCHIPLEDLLICPLLRSRVGLLQVRSLTLPSRGGSQGRKGWEGAMGQGGDGPMAAHPLHEPFPVDRGPWVGLHRRSGVVSSVLLIHNAPCYCSVGVPAGRQGVGSSCANGCIRFTCDLPRLS